MKVLILAAGRGTRISRYLSGKPKCTVDIGGGQCLIEYTIDLLHSRGIQDIGIVLGYEAQVIREVLADKGVSFFYNPFYDVTNSIASAWFAKEFLTGDDLLIMNGDVYLEEKLLDRILAQGRSPVMFADESRRETADYKFFYEDGILKLEVYDKGKSVVFSVDIQTGKMQREREGRLEKQQEYQLKKPLVNADKKYKNANNHNVFIKKIIDDNGIDDVLDEYTLDGKFVRRIFTHDLYDWSLVYANDKELIFRVYGENKKGYFYTVPLLNVDGNDFPQMAKAKKIILYIIQITMILVCIIGKRKSLLM